MFNCEDDTAGLVPLTPEIIAAAVQYVRKACKANKKYGTILYQNASGLKATAEFIKVIIDRQWLCSAVSPTTGFILLFSVVLNIYVLGSHLFESSVGH